MKLAGAYINDDTYERLVALAAANNRTLAGQCRHLFDRALRGDLTVPDGPALKAETAGAKAHAADAAAPLTLPVAGADAAAGRPRASRWAAVPMDPATGHLRRTRGGGGAGRAAHGHAVPGAAARAGGGHAGACHVPAPGAPFLTINPQPGCADDAGHAPHPRHTPHRTRRTAP